MSVPQAVNQLISSKDYKDFVANGNRIIILTTAWCKTAVMMSIIFERLYPKYKQYMEFAKVDVDNFPEIIQHERVGAVPEFLIYKDGKLHCRKHCTHNESIEQFIDKFLQTTGAYDVYDDY